MGFLLCLLFISSVWGSTLYQRSEPAPYFFEDDGNSVPDTYMIKLHAEHTIEAHFEFIGRNLTQTVENFAYLELINAYRITVDHDILHNRIRYDPGVQRVTHDRYYFPEPEPEPEVENPGPPPESYISRLSKRWTPVERFDFWFLSMLSDTKVNSVN